MESRFEPRGAKSDRVTQDIKNVIVKELLKRVPTLTLSSGSFEGPVAPVPSFCWFPSLTVGLC